MVRRLSILFVALALLAACGAAPAAPPTSPSAAAPAQGAISVESPGGTLTLEQPAARVVACSEEALDFLVALGVQPVGFCSDRSEGVTSGQPYELPHFFPRERIGTPTFVGSAATPSAELIATLSPDLIISTDYTEGNEQLAQIAPTFQLSVDAPGYWRETLQDIGRLLGRESEAAQFLAEYDATVERLAAEIAPVAAKSPNLLLVYSFGASEGTMLLGNAWTGSRPFTQLGFRVLEPAGVSFANGVAPISPETVVQAEADIIFVLRPELADGTRPSYPLDELLAARDDVRVVYQVFPSTRGSTAPYTDRFVLEEVAGLLAPAATAEPAFPVTLVHKYGSTEIPAAPTRIVTVGLTEQDALLGLGITPVGTTEWFGEHPGALWPWAQEKLTGEPPAVVGDAEGPNFEAIAALKPDLILALYSGITQEQYDLLSQIAPTVAQPEAYVDYGVPWQELTRTVGRAVGKAVEADALVAEVEARFEAVRAAHPEFRGASAVVATPYEGIWVYGPEDVRGRLLTTLGFTLPTGLAEVTGAEFGGNLSLERADLLDVDVIIWLDPEQAQGPLGGPVYSSLPVHTEGREVMLDSDTSALGGATSFVSVLSLPYLLDGLVPQLEAALDGNPATTVTP